jgi:O-antigen biosynthesis protein
MTAVAVAISTRDRAEALARCLDSLAAGTLMPSEVVVVDQGSDDAAGAVVDARQALGFAVRRVVQRERGLAVSQNAAIRSARAEVVAVTDDDCVAAETWLAVVAAAFGDDPELGLLTGRVLPLPTADTRLVPVSTRPSTKRARFSGRVDPWEVGSGNNFAVRRTWFDRIGGCDVRLGPGTPGRGALDMDPFYRLIRAGAPARYEPEAVVYHEQKSRAERRARRPDYGFGMGVCCMLWRGAGDDDALDVLVRWLRLRARLAVVALGRLRLRGAFDEVLMLLGTFRGMIHGARAAR